MNERIPSVDAIDFAPSAVKYDARSYLPFVGTFNKGEAEVAAAMLVRACEFHGDRWQPITFAHVKEALKHDVDTKREPFATWMRNPFARPDIHRLVADGFVAEVGDAHAFTAKAFEAMRRWVLT